MQYQNKNKNGQTEHDAPKPSSFNDERLQHSNREHFLGMPVQCPRTPHAYAPIAIRTTPNVRSERTNEQWF